MMGARDAGQDNQRQAKAKHDAAAWVELIVSGRATTADYEAMMAWRGQCDAHSVAYAEAVKLHRLLGIRPMQDGDYYRPSVWERPATRRALVGGGVALLAGYGAVRPPLGLWPSLGELSSDYRTAVGERSTVAFADGVSIQLNTRTNLKRRGREGIELENGEIAVAAGKSSPIKIFADGAMIFAENATFNLRKRDVDGSLTCVDGAISIQQGQERMTVRASQQIRYTVTTIGRPVSVDPFVVTAWQRGLIVFRNSRLSDVVSEVNRYRPGKIVIANSGLAEKRLTGQFRIDRIANAVSQIEQVTKATALPLVGGIVLLA